MFYKSKVSCLMGEKNNFFLKIKYKKCDKKNGEVRCRYGKECVLGRKTSMSKYIGLGGGG